MLNQGMNPPGDIGLEKPFLEGLGDGARAGMHVELGVDIPQMGIDGVIAERKLIGDFLLDQPLRHELQDPLFTGGEAVIVLRQGKP